MKMAWLRKRQPPVMVQSASDIARHMAALGHAKRRAEYATRLRLTTLKLRYELAAGVVSPIAPTEGWR